MSASHTVVALAGGTGSGKSSLFNALAGANFSPAGVTRPTTKHSHACVWGMEGAAPLLDWLGVQRRHRYARASALDEGEASLTGMLLLDLPDHDSVVTGSAALVDRLVKMADMLVWVLDPLKYADASVHRRYLVPLAGHAAVTTVVLNQVDTLSPDQAADCETDLRRLLDAEGLTETQVLVTSATTGAGLDELRRVLAGAVAARRAADRADRGGHRRPARAVRGVRRGLGARLAPPAPAEPALAAAPATAAPGHSSGPRPGLGSPALGAGRRRGERGQRAGRRGRLAALADERGADAVGDLVAAAVGRRHPGRQRRQQGHRGSRDLRPRRAGRRADRGLREGRRRRGGDRDAERRA